ncbi:MAG: glycoside hydrolase family 55 protein [Xanthomonadales bacterium]|nr:glycoside hydrolase family 55 protein [Xanthomonadales bacterium]
MKNKMKKFLCFASLLFLSAALQAENIEFPTDSGVINIKTAYGAKGDGVTDDTQAIVNAIKAHVGKNKIIYFPNGTYLVSDRLAWRDSSGEFQAYLSFQGQSRANTIIKLKDASTGYTDPSTPKAVIFTASLDDGVPQVYDRSKGEGLQAFRNAIRNLTVDTGTGNPGAIGIDYILNNVGAIRDVTIRSGDGQGVRGLSMARRYPGPGFIKNVSIEGFDYGIYVLYRQTSMTFENITLQNQIVAGIYNRNNILSIRGLSSINSVPVIQNLGPFGLVTVLDGEFSGGSSSQSAIENNNGSILYARNIVTSGYQAAIKNNGQVVAGATQSEFVSDAVLSLFPSPARSLHLPIEDTPTVPDDPIDEWANVEDFGADANDLYNNDTAGIQAAMDSGATTIYFPQSNDTQGYYLVDKTIFVRGNVRRIVGLNASVGIAWTNSFNDPANPKPIFRFEEGASDVVVFEQFYYWATFDADPDAPAKYFVSYEHASPKTLVIKSSTDRGFRNTRGVGKLFLEDVVAVSPWLFNHPQQIWARQLNPENSGTKITNNGGSLWILGMKTERPTTVIETTGGGKTELLGGMIIPVEVTPTDVTAFINNESNHSLIYAVNAESPAANYEIQVKETRDGETRYKYRGDMPSRALGTKVALYTGYEDDTLVNDNFDSGINTGTIGTSGSATIEISNEQAVSLNNSLKISDATDTSVPHHPSIRWSFNQQNDNTLRTSFYIRKETSGYSAFFLDLVGSGIKRGRVRYSTDSIVVQDSSTGFLTVASNLSDQRWYQVEIEISTQTTAKTYTVTVKELDGTIVGRRSDLKFWGNNPGSIDQIVFTDDGSDTSVFYLDSVIVEPGAQVIFADSFE